MVIANTKAKSVYNTNGVTREWQVGFNFDSNVSSLHIIVEDEKGNDTEINANFTYKDGVITYPTVESELPPVKAGNKIIIYRSTPNTQDIDLIQHGTLDAETLESGYDKLTLQVQEVAEKVDRAVKLPIGSNDIASAEDYLKSIEEAKDEALREIDDSIMQASDEVENARAQVGLAQEQVGLATEQANTAKSYSAIAKDFAHKANKESISAYASAGNALDYANKALASYTKTKELAEDAKLPSYSITQVIAGTPSENYDGNLNTIPTTEYFVSNSTYVYVNGQYKERGEEYQENEDKHSITFTYDLVAGDRVVIFTSIGWFEKRDIQTFEEAINNHNNNKNSHPDIRALLQSLGVEENAIIDLGLFNKNQSIVSSKTVELNKTPLEAFVQFSDQKGATWLMAVNSFAGFEKLEYNKYNIFYSVSSSDFCGQNIIKGPFRVQVVIKYLGDISNILKNIEGFDVNKTQTLKNINGKISWVEE